MLPHRVIVTIFLTLLSQGQITSALPLGVPRPRGEGIHGEKAETFVESRDSESANEVPADSEFLNQSRNINTDSSKEELPFQSTMVTVHVSIPYFHILRQTSKATTSVAAPASAIGTTAASQVAFNHLRNSLYHYNPRAMIVAGEQVAPDDSCRLALEYIQNILGPKIDGLAPIIQKTGANTDTLVAANQKATETSKETWQIYKNWWPTIATTIGFGVGFFSYTGRWFGPVITKLINHLFPEDEPPKKIEFTEEKCKDINKYLLNIAVTERNEERQKVQEKFAELFHANGKNKGKAVPVLEDKVYDEKSKKYKDPKWDDLEDLHRLPAEINEHNPEDLKQIWEAFMVSAASYTESLETKVSGQEKTGIFPFLKATLKIAESAILVVTGKNPVEKDDLVKQTKAALDAIPLKKLNKEGKETNEAQSKSKDKDKGKDKGNGKGKQLVGYNSKDSSSSDRLTGDSGSYDSESATDADSEASSSEGSARAGPSKPNKQKAH